MEDVLQKGLVGSDIIGRQWHSKTFSTIYNGQTVAQGDVKLKQKVFIYKEG